LTILQELPPEVIALVRSASTAEYVTISAAGLPIDTPVLFFPSEGLRSFDIATGLSYPAKAERARRNPRTAILIEGEANEPVVAIAGMASVRDADLQANTERYLSEASHMLPLNPSWDLAQKAVWYWTRMLVEITPVRILWWDTPAAMDSAPHRWDAPAGTAFRPSDPAPAGSVSKSPKWEQPPWHDLAERALARGVYGHLSVIDNEGFPISVRARSITLTEDGFTLDLPKGLPSPIAGPATFTFGGVETFIGEMTSGSVLKVERTLPVFPITEDPTQLWEPSDHTRSELMKRLNHETERRGQPIPTIPAIRPGPTEGYKLRMARFGVNVD
jgi:hypothetical protein